MVRANFLRCGRSDNFFEARVAAQRVPHWIEFEIAIGRAKPGTTGDGILRRSCELLDGRILVASVDGDSRSNIGQSFYVNAFTGT